MDSTGDIDRISALPDELLHVILAGVGEATAVTRTAVLSKRWRRVWIHAQRLELVDTEVTLRDDTPDCFAGFVDWVLACRGDADIGCLEINMPDHSPYCCASPVSVNEWLRYAMRRVVEAFCLRLPYQPSRLSRIRRILDGLPPYDVNGPAVVFPSHGRVGSIKMGLSHHKLQLPVAAAAMYEALTELDLSHASLNEDAPGSSGRTLGDFVSSCCPRLRKLRVSRPIGLPQLVIRSETLEELTLRYADGLNMVDVAAPCLRVLKLEYCFHDTLGSLVATSTQAATARIAAGTTLEEIAICYTSIRRRPSLEIHGLASVRRLSELQLYMDGPYCFDCDKSLWLLENCPGVEHIEVSLVHAGRATNSGLVDLTAEGAAPFANVRSIVLNAPLFSGAHLVSSTTSLLSRCPLLRSLSVHITKSSLEGFSSGAKCVCDELDTWRFHQKFFLGSLEEVTMHGFAGAGEDVDLLTLLFESSSSIRRVTIHATTDNDESPGYDCLKLLMEADDEHDTETTDKMLMNIPCTDRGCWHFGEAVYTWTCHAPV